LVQLRIMNSAGVVRFREVLAALRSGENSPLPNLNNAEYSDGFSVTCDIDLERKFQTKYELGQYILERFTSSGIKREEIIQNAGIWTWLGYVWLRQLTGGETEKPGIGDDSRYIFSDDFRKNYRHLVWLPYDMISLHGKEASMLFLYGRVDKQGDFIEQALSRMDIHSNTSIIMTSTKLYFDSGLGKNKKGAQNRSRPGNFRRFVEVLKQLDLVYDLASCSPDEIMTLLPAEFDKWRT